MRVEEEWVWVEGRRMGVGGGGENWCRWREEVTALPGVLQVISLDLPFKMFPVYHTNQTISLDMYNM